MSDLELSGKCAVVIGGTAGIGKELALGLAEAGADVVASSRSKENTAAMTEAIHQKGRRSLNHPSDVLDRSSLESLCSAVLREWGAVDILVNCAGRTQRVPTLDCSEEIWQSIFDVNLMGTLRSCQIFGRSMLERGSGRIINIASLSSFVAFHEVAAYGASKAGVASLTRSLAVEWASKGVLVNAIAPGIFPTALNGALLDSPRGQELGARTPMARFGHASELVSTAVYLASDRTTFTTGQILVVDGGFLASGVNR
jgi:NAD(P)-dependent dehydrogenase (short-subunit alcohol dehydrogenase family)